MIPVFPERYKFTKTKLSGGMGDVFVCDDCNLNRKVAIKIIKAPSDSRRMLDEITAFEQLRSKHVVEIFDIIDFGGKTLGIVQDFLPGDDLLTYVKAIALSADEYLKILYQVACGISDIHNIGRIHRDIKPNNIKFDQEKLLKIFDLGLARTDGDDSRTKGFVGTFGFSAPELFSSGLVEFTKKIDVYSFGATAYFIAMNDLPKDLRNCPPSIDPKVNYFSHIRISDIPEQILFKLNSCLANDASDRPDIDDVRDMLSRYLLFGKHKANLGLGTKKSVLDKVGQEIRGHRDGIGSIKIQYDGLYFKAIEVDGEIFINNKPANSGQILPGSCVITFGNAHRKAERKYVTFDVSNPEVVL